MWGSVESCFPTIINGQVRQIWGTLHPLPPSPISHSVLVPLQHFSLPHSWYLIWKTVSRASLAVIVWFSWNHWLCTIGPLNSHTLTSWWISLPSHCMMAMSDIQGLRFGILLSSSVQWSLFENVNTILHFIMIILQEWGEDTMKALILLIRNTDC